MKLKKMPQLSLVTLIIISILGCAMEIDISIPSFPSLMSFFSASEAQVQNTLSFNFLAFCLSGLFYGPLSEGYGRRGLMIYGAACFLIGAIGCVFSYSIYQLTFWRFIQGLGASSTLVLGFTMISDKYNTEQAANYIGKINAYITIFMATAPILGSLLVSYFDWRANFTVIAVIAFVAFWCLLLQLPETNLNRKKVPFSSILRDYWFLMTHREFMLVSTIPNLFVTAYLTFLANAAFYYINSCHLSYFEYGIHQGLIVLSFSIMSFYSNKVVAKLGSRRAINFGLLFYTSGILLLSYAVLLFPFEAKLITFAMCILSVGAAFPISVTFAQSLDIVPALKGASSSFIMSSRLLISSAAIALTGIFFDGSMMPVAVVYCMVLILVFCMYLVVNLKYARVEVSVS
jgi:DHA1 family bicyclomycin/chloramphenicol resistance-like MFS transporter